MPPATARKRPKRERHEQLLECAFAIIRDEGADALTLARVAERAGVSKPIAYDHFGTREALMIALYKRIDDRQVAALKDALPTLEQRLETVAEAIAQAYLSCAAAVGAEWSALSAALKGSEAMEAVKRELNGDYLALYRDALAPFAPDIAPTELHLRCIAILGAAERVCDDVLRGVVATADAAAFLARLISTVMRQHRDGERPA